MATGVSLQESYLRGRGSERSDLGVPAVSRNTHQLTDDLFRSKIPLEFEAERLEEHLKPTGVGVEGLETLTGSPETDRLAYKEVVDSHRAPQHMSHVESKVIARRIQIEEPSRLIIRRKPPEEVLQIEMLKHVARVDGLALEMFHGSTVPAIYILFENPSRESTRTLGQLCRIAAIEEYEEWGEWRTVWKLPQLRATVTAARTTTPYEVGGAVRWERGTSSADNGLESSKGGRISTTDNDHGTGNNDDDDDYTECRSTARQDRMRRSMETRHEERRFWARRSKGKMDIRDEARRRPSRSQFEGQWPVEIDCAIRWKQGAKSASTELDGSEVHFDFETLYLHLCYSREGSCLRRSAIAAQESTKDYERKTLGRTAKRIRGTTTIYEERQRTIEEKLHDVIQWRYYEWGERSEGTMMSDGDNDDGDDNRRTGDEVDGAGCGAVAMQCENGHTVDTRHGGHERSA
ncbi:hypothetical protein M404DRAFT_22635 [Pisolithus tinctorius Marx 270]|uniref:Uncharacterized protein n=1 Tax=Pisolithus tinctorius Marx 270 TaxID=870435 RepID=A0A0C3KGP4_PISTI|nr:hypothetical protein M404DRAFT_22635 [Pisolithus tinctorius Marx 270]